MSQTTPAIFNRLFLAASSTLAGHISPFLHLLYQGPSNDIDYRKLPAPMTSFLVTCPKANCTAGLLPDSFLEGLFQSPNVL